MFLLVIPKLRKLAREQGIYWIWKNDLSGTVSSIPCPCAVKIGTLSLGMVYVYFLLNVQFV